MLKWDEKKVFKTTMRVTWSARRGEWGWLEKQNWAARVCMWRVAAVSHADWPTVRSQQLNLESLAYLRFSNDLANIVSVPTKWQKYHCRGLSRCHVFSTMLPNRGCILSYIWTAARHLSRSPSAGPLRLCSRCIEGVCRASSPLQALAACPTCLVRPARPAMGKFMVWIEVVFMHSPNFLQTTHVFTYEIVLLF